MAVKTVDEYIENHADRKDSLMLLRKVLASTELEEAIKWGGPVYTVKGKNVVGLGAFKSFVAIWFFQGALLRDENKVLVNAQEGKTKALRQWRFGTSREVEESIASIRAYVQEAIENQKGGREIKPDRNKELVIPEELLQVFGERPNVKDAFQQLSLSRQRDYAEYIESAKKTETKIARLEKIIPMIEQGIGLNDKYK